MQVSIIVATYNQPQALERVLWGYAVQTHRDFELLVADDGSGPETARVIERLREEAGLDITHVWHEDDGFRKTEILNRAIVAASGDYCIFTDGDCIPRDDFVATHVRLAAPGAFLAGGYLKLPAAVSEQVTVEAVRAGRATDLGWLRAQGWRPGRRTLRLLRDERLPAFLDRITGHDPKWRGCNSSTWREALLAINGFDNDMAYGGEDRALGERLVNYGLRGTKIRYRTPVVHLDHARPYSDPAIARRNAERCEQIRRDHVVRARDGIAQLAPSAKPASTT